MFNKYWREYPAWLQMLLLLLMVFTMMSAAVALSSLLTPLLTGVPVTDIIAIGPASTRKTLNAFLLLQMINNIFAFGGVAFLYAYASHPRPWQYLGFRSIRRPFLIIVAVVLLFGAMPLVLQLGQWLRDLNFSAVATAAQEKNDEVMKAIMQGQAMPEFLFTVFVLAVVPAFGEEMFFRGILMRFLHKQTLNLFFAIFMSAAIFALFHFQPYNLPSIFIMGMILGYVYYYTGSIWVSIFLHFLNNASQVTIEYMAGKGYFPASVTEQENFAWYVLVIASGIAILAFYMLKKQAAPLPLGWSSDFTIEELEQKLEDLNNHQ